MRAFDAIPVFRPRDGADASRNEETFRRCRELLERGGWLMLFPEGTSHSDPQLKPLKTGAARIALQAEAAADFKLGVRIVPVGLLYEDKTIFRSRVGAALGEPRTLERYRDRYREDERQAVEELTAEIDAALSAVVLEADSRELWNGIVAVAGWTSEDGGKDVARLEERSRELARAFTRLQARDPARATQIVEDTRRFATALRSVGVDDPFSLEAPLAPRLGTLVRFVLPVVTLWPVALVGAVLGWVPYRLVGLLAVRLAKTETDVVSTLKAILGLVVMIGAWAAEGVVAGLRFGALAGLLTFVAGPLTGYVAVRYEERVRLRREALHRLWLRASRADMVIELARRRQELARVVAEELAAARAA
jgi:glycerol-3-phosphate O-acyltransferase/dihydroxyacetone phosphate acyltransferase